ncbi:MAG: bifunctional oligoribonuclease/PAP phosphatase NrnA [Treponema sp.]|nr:bifunctional oligoribonuclease/PAP phosphatase NrnA [Treponema sp.]
MENTRQTITDFIAQNTRFVLTTHDTPDADGIGAEIALAFILEKLEKEALILNASPIPERFRFMDPLNKAGIWDQEKHGGLPGAWALIILDTSDEFHTGAMKEVIPLFKETMTIDHHELNPRSAMRGYIDPAAAATCELIMEIAAYFNQTLDSAAATAAFAGLSYDSGSFAYSKTTARTFKAAQTLVAAGAKPYEIHGFLNENDSTAALLLQGRVIAGLTLHCGGKAALMTLGPEDLAVTGALFEDAESFVNIPLKSKGVLVSILLKETGEGKIRCSLRSKGAVNVSKIAQQFSGGGHALAAGFRSDASLEETINQVLEKIREALKEAARASAEPKDPQEKL